MSEWVHVSFDGYISDENLAKLQAQDPLEYGAKLMEALGLSHMDCLMVLPIEGPELDDDGKVKPDPGEWDGEGVPL